MTTDFFRLYRELERVGPDSKPIDISYDRERKEIMKTLGFDVKDTSTRVQRPKHHGKFARRTEASKKQEALLSNFGEEYRKRKVFHDVLYEAGRLNDASTQLGKLISEKKPIPKKIWTLLTPLAAKPKTALVERKALPPIESNEVIPRVSVQLSCPPSSNLWTNPERKRLNSLYHEVRRPPAPNLLMWKVYYETMAARFRTFYPQRSEAEVISKLEDMILKRQMKEDGEVVYWRNICGGKA